jgi:membrane-bound ClpP family serine protease
MDPTYLTMGLALIGVGFVLMVAELFFPSHGILLAMGALMTAGGVTLSYNYDTQAGLYTTVGVAFALPAVGGLALYIWPKTPLGKRLFLNRPDADTTLASTTISKELEQLRGRFGRAISALRPAGVVDFEGRRVDTVTEGLMVDPGQWVRCVDVQGNRVVVRPVDKPNLDTLESVDFS